MKINPADEQRQKQEEKAMKRKMAFRTVILNILCYILITIIAIPIVMFATNPSYKYLFQLIINGLLALLLFFAAYVFTTDLIWQMRDEIIVVIILIGVLIFLMIPTVLGLAHNFIKLAPDLPQYISKEASEITALPISRTEHSHRYRFLIYNSTEILFQLSSGESIILYGDYKLDSSKLYKVHYYDHSRLIKDVHPIE